MATESIQFFMRRDEFRELIGRLRDRLQLYVILHRSDSSALELARSGLSFGEEFESDTLYLSSSEPARDTLLDLHEPNPAAWGWVEVDVPVESASVLYLAQAGTKVEWYDPSCDSVRKNAEGLKLFRAIAKEFRSVLSGPVWAENVVYGGRTAYPSIRYSPGAAEFARSGGELRQRDVDNVRFFLEPPQ